jgi:hypothetical protein
MRARFASLFLASFVLAAAAGQAPTPATLGPKVGDRVPDFTLPDQNGVARPLASLLGPKGAVLVFFRSADW